MNHFSQGNIKVSDVQVFLQQRRPEMLSVKLLMLIISKNKKVLLRERKRHTARRIASGRYAGRGGTPSSHGGGVPPSSHGGGYPIPGLVGGVPQPVPRVTCPPHPDLRWGTPSPIHRPWMGYVPTHLPPPHKCEQTENVTFPHPSGGGR